MKTSFTLGLALAAIMAGGLITTSNAMAAPVIHGGTICHNNAAGEANYFDFDRDGIKNVTNVPRRATCPFVVTHTPGATSGYFYLNYSTSSPINCTVYSYTFYDAFLGSKTFTTGTGNGQYYVGNVPADSYSTHTVACTLPPNGTGKITGLETYF